MSRELLCEKCAIKFTVSMIDKDSVIFGSSSQHVFIGELPTDPGFFYRLVYGKAKLTTDEQRTIKINGEPCLPNPSLLCDLCSVTVNIGDRCACRTIVKFGVNKAPDWEHDLIEVKA